MQRVKGFANGYLIPSETLLDHHHLGRFLEVILAARPTPVSYVQDKTLLVSWLARSPWSRISFTSL